jgi:hypothetical protein
MAIAVSAQRLQVEDVIRGDLGAPAAGVARVWR